MTAPTTPELLNCPFCDGEATARCIKDSCLNHIECGNCGCRGCYGTTESVTAAWNTRAALAAPALLWLPIESAPKHTEVLVWREDSGPFIAQFSTPEGVFATDVLEKMGDSFGDDFEEWYSEAYGWQEGSEKPTHWQPLPGAPTHA